MIKKTFIFTLMFLIAFGFYVPSGFAQTPGGINIPDPNLRAVVEKALGKEAGVPITRAEMLTLTSLDGRGTDISDLSGIEFATNLTTLSLQGNQISDISPLAGLTNLGRLNLGWVSGNQISDVTPLAGLTNLTFLALIRNQISDISPLAGLTNLTQLRFNDNEVSDISALAGLTNLTSLWFDGNEVSDVTPLAGLTNLTYLSPRRNQVSDVTPLAGLTNLTNLYIEGNEVSDVTPLAGLTNLGWLLLGYNQVSDVTPLAGLTNLEDLALQNNQVSDVTPLAGLTNLEDLNLRYNQVSDASELAALTNLGHLDIQNNQISDPDTLTRLLTQMVVYFSGNPAFETPGPKIEAPWLWMIVPGERYGWRAVRSGKDYLSEASGGSVTEVDIAAKGATVRDVVGDSGWMSGTLAPTGDNNLDKLIDSLGLGADISYPTVYGVISVESPQEQHTRLYIGSHSVKIWFNGVLVHVDPGYLYGVRDYLTAIPVTLKQGENRLFVAAYNRYSSLFLGFEVGTDYTVLEPRQTLLTDINADGTVDFVDVFLVITNLYQTPAPDAPLNPDVNRDGIVDIKDLAEVAVDAANQPAAPSAHAQLHQYRNEVGLPKFSAETVQRWLVQARQLGIENPTYQKGIAFLEQLLVLLIEADAVPAETTLLPNYPNPFNPETWIPYHLAAPADVRISIYATEGSLVQTLDLGYQPVGVYVSRNRAAYWNGRNALGEPVASGVYFYTFTAGDFTATQKMLIRK